MEDDHANATLAEQSPGSVSAAAQTRTTGGRVPTSKRGQATRAKLLAAAEDCFGRLGYADASVAEIVRAASVSQGGFYVYFASKEAIFRELVMNMAQQIRAVTRQAIDSAANRCDAEVAGTRAFLRWLYEHRRLHRVLHQIDEVDEDLAKRFYMSVSEPYTERLSAAMAAGEITDTDPELLAYALMGINHFVSMRWVLWTGSDFPSDKMDHLERLILRLLG
jgi:AcrR family transcriptional regulator